MQTVTEDDTTLIFNVNILGSDYNPAEKARNLI